jgi:pyruvate formate lyase activating enzyme
MGKGLIFNIQRYSLHDGMGIRTIIFLKGCPLFCPWCSNPESQGLVKPIVWEKKGIKETLGKWMTVDEVLEEVLKDHIFFRTSKGGVTLSGGEPLLQIDFVKDLLKELKDLGIHTAMETTGCMDIKRIKTILPYLDQILFDLKFMNPEQAKSIIGADIHTIKENFKLAWLSKKTKVIPRIPLIPGFTSKEENLMEIIEFLKEFKVPEVHILPFHQYGNNKYEYLNREYTMKSKQTLTFEEITSIKNLFQHSGISANVDGLE